MVFQEIDAELPSAVRSEEPSLVDKAARVDLGVEGKIHDAVPDIHVLLEAVIALDVGQNDGELLLPDEVLHVPQDVIGPLFEGHLEQEHPGISDAKPGNLLRAADS